MKSVFENLFSIEVGPNVAQLKNGSEANFLSTYNFSRLDEFLKTELFQTYERFCNVAIVLERMVVNLASKV